jgi:RNA recognition motif-containing protein
MGTKLYVGNLSYDSTEASLRAAFEADGRQVREVAMIMDRETGRPKGFGFIQMGSEQDAQSAIAALDGKQLDGRAIKVNEAQERPRVDVLAVAVAVAPSVATATAAAASATRSSNEIRSAAGARGSPAADLHSGLSTRERQSRSATWPQSKTICRITRSPASCA